MKKIDKSLYYYLKWETHHIVGKSVAKSSNINIPKLFRKSSQKMFAEDSHLK